MVSKMKVYALWKSTQPRGNYFSYVPYVNIRTPDNASPLPTIDTPILLGLYKTIEGAQRAQMSIMSTGMPVWIEEIEVRE